MSQYVDQLKKEYKQEPKDKPTQDKKNLKVGKCSSNQMVFIEGVNDKEEDPEKVQDMFEDKKPIVDNWVWQLGTPTEEHLIQDYSGSFPCLVESNKRYTAFKAGINISRIPTPNHKYETPFGTKVHISAKQKTQPQEKAIYTLIDQVIAKGKPIYITLTSEEIDVFEQTSWMVHI